MQNLFQSAKRLISLCLVTLLLITSTITIFPSPALAGDVVFLKCESDCGNIMSFAAGVASGSAVTLMATGHAGTLATVAATALGPLTATAPALMAAAPVLIPAAATAAAGYAVYSLLSPHSPN